MIEARPTRRRRARVGLALAALPLWAAGCTVFTDYNEATEEPMAAFVRGDLDGAIRGYSEGLEASNDALVYHLEAGTAAHVAGRWEESLRLFAAAHRLVEEYLDRALVSASDVGQTAASFLLNEKTLPYTGAAFEQVLLQAYQARNFLLAGRREGVLVEVLRCYDLQDKARRLHEEELRSARGAGSSGAGVPRGEVERCLRETYAHEGGLASAEDVFDPRWVRYLNAFLREAVGDRQADWNAALIDLKVVADRFDHLPFVRRDLVRLTALSGDPAEAAELAKRWDLPFPDDSGSVALFFECGLAPSREEVKVIFPTNLHLTGWAAVAMPRYRPVPDPAVAALLVVGGQEARTATLSSVEAIAGRYFADRLPLLVAKQVVRLAAKIAIQEGSRRVIRHQDDRDAVLLAEVVSLIASLWNVATEQADLRCWRTLPRTLQATRVYLPPGRHPVSVVLLGAGGRRLDRVELGEVEVGPGQHGLVDARSVGSRLWAHLAPPRPGPAAAARQE